MPDTAGIDADLTGTASPPRDNGEIVFSAPWEQRVFGLTVAMCRSGRCDWERFRQGLIGRIAEDESRPYWKSWAAAFEDVLAETETLAKEELDLRHREFVARPHGHDHDHH